MLAFMKRFCLTWLAGVVATAGLLPAHGQTVIDRRHAQISDMLAQVSAQNIEQTVRKLESFYTRHSLSDTLSDERGIGAARRWIKSELEAYARAGGGRMRVEFDPFVAPEGRRIPKATPMKNVLAILPGSDADDDRVIIVSGHYDSRASDAMDATSFAPGAADDASGTAVTMELARVMAGRQFPLTIIFAAVAAEEQGLLGSAHLAERAQREGWNLIAMITNDIVGNTHSSGTDIRNNRQMRVFSEGVPQKMLRDLVQADSLSTMRRAARALSRYLATTGENDSPSRQFARYIKEVGERYVDQFRIELIYRRDRFLRGGDHTPFNRLGFRAVRLTEMNEFYPRQHQDVRHENGTAFGDVADAVDYGFVARVARVNLATLANLALAPSVPENPGIVVSRLTNDTTLRWNKPAHGQVHGYYVLIRETNAPTWQKKIFVSGVTEVTLPYSKDNFLFAVQAVGPKGFESLPVVPQVVR